MQLSGRQITHGLLLTIFACQGLFAVWIAVEFHRGRWDVPEVPVSTYMAQRIELGTPELLSIPAIDVNADVQSIGLAPDGSGAMDVPSNFVDVGWYNLGPVPGDRGSSVITGHLSGRHIPNAVFHRLDELSRGDIVEVTDEYGNVLQFEVIDTKTYPYNASTEEVFEHTGRPRLNLITCGGKWIKDAEIFSERTVVFTELIHIEEKV